MLLWGTIFWPRNNAIYPINVSCNVARPHLQKWLKTLKTGSVPSLCHPRCRGEPGTRRGRYYFHTARHSCLSLASIKQCYSLDFRWFYPHATPNLFLPRSVKCVGPGTTCCYYIHTIIVMVFVWLQCLCLYCFYVDINLFSVHSRFVCCRACLWYLVTLTWILLMIFNCCFEWILMLIFMINWHCLNTYALWLHYPCTDYDWPAYTDIYWLIGLPMLINLQACNLLLSYTIA